MSLWYNISRACVEDTVIVSHTQTTADLLGISDKFGCFPCLHSSLWILLALVVFTVDVYQCGVYLMQCTWPGTIALRRNRAGPLQVADFVDVTSDVISIATISGAATSFGANQFPSGSRSKHVLDVYSTPYPEIKPDPTVLTPSAVHAVCRTPVNRSTVTTATTAATTSTTKVPTVTICKAGTTPTPNNGQVVTIYSFEEGCEGGRGEGQVVVSQESGENKLSALGKKTVAGQAMEKGVTIEDTERKGAPPRRAILGQARGGQADTDTKQGQTAASTPHGDSSTLINAKAGTCSYSSNGTCNRTVTFESSGVSLTEPSADLEEITNGRTPSHRKHSTTPEVEDKHPWDWSSRRSKLLVGAIISLTSAVTWVAFSQLLQNSFHESSFDAPFTLTYFFLACLLLLFPGYLCVARIAHWQSTGDILRECIHIYRGNDEFSWVAFLWKTLLFCFVMALTLYTYFRALFKLSAADCTALFAAHHSFVYLMSWIVLFEKFVAMRIFAMIFSITGIVLFAYVDGFGSPAMFGVVMGVAASSGGAVYGVLYKKFIGVATPVQAFFFLSNIGLFSLLLLWPIWLLLFLFGVEDVTWANIPFSLVLPSTLLYVVYMVTRESVVLLTYPVFLGLGLVLAVPLCALGDTVWKHRVFSGMKIAALVLITIGVLLILLPENWHDFICRRLRSKRQETEDAALGNSTTLRGRLRRASYM
ncbi:hypothetical protein RRG08_018282 [Elysia crispata]|uniref:Solute carrier family 35 member F4 n=1 Tax=Elysia crispata TaxID=231223 RepID=A0AAE1DP53_9GAST|nr:hypothetical protein RRG08_018282 [Elysia crispata]